MQKNQAVHIFFIYQLKDDFPKLSIPVRILVLALYVTGAKRKLEVKTMQDKNIKTIDTRISMQNITAHGNVVKYHSCLKQIQ